jgi:hypothetical protein
MKSLESLLNTFNDLYDSCPQTLKKLRAYDPGSSGTFFKIKKLSNLQHV